MKVDWRPRRVKSLRSAFLTILANRREHIVDAARRYERENNPSAAETEYRALDEIDLIEKQIREFKMANGKELQIAIFLFTQKRYDTGSNLADELRANGLKNEAACAQCAANEARYLGELAVEKLTGSHRG